MQITQLREGRGGERRRDSLEGVFSLPTTSPTMLSSSHIPKPYNNKGRKAGDSSSSLYELYNIFPWFWSVFPAVAATLIRHIQSVCVIHPLYPLTLSIPIDSLMKESDSFSLLEAENVRFIIGTLFRVMSDRQIERKCNESHNVIVMWVKADFRCCFFFTQSEWLRRKRTAVSVASSLSISISRCYSRILVL